MDAETLLSRVGESLSVRRAFGDPIERNGFLVIPVALVAGGGGGGEGQVAPSSTGPASGNEKERVTSDGSKNDTAIPPIGSGGGLGGVIVPMGVYVIRGDRVVWKPAVQPVLLAIFALGLVRLITRHILN